MLNIFVKPNIIQTAEVFCKLQEIKVTSDSIKKELEEHPDFPSLLSLSDTLHNFNIENVVARFDIDQLDKIPTPFITKMKNEKTSKGYFTIIKNVNSQFVTFYNYEYNKWEKKLKESFLPKWSGIALLTATTIETGEHDYESKRKAVRKNRITRLFPLIVLLSIVIINIFLLPAINNITRIPEIIFSLLTILGCCMSAIILKLESEQSNPLLRRICNINSSTNCAAVLNSKGAKIFGIKWSIIGFSYFAGGAFTLILSEAFYSYSYTLLYLLSVVVSPYIIYSVYFQWRIAQKWCTICLAIQVILASQFLLVLYSGFPKFDILLAIPLKSYLSILFTYTFTYLVSSNLISAFARAKEATRYRKEIQRLKKSPSIFQALLSKERVANDSSGLGILIGDARARIKIIKVCNPYCEPCSIAHRALHDLLQSVKNVQIQIIFTASNNEADRRREPVRHLMAIADNNNEKVVKEALDAWYLAEKKDYKKFSERFPIDARFLTQDKKIESMKNWCRENGISHTPTLFINGYQLPQGYQVSDLKSLLV